MHFLEKLEPRILLSADIIPLPADSEPLESIPFEPISSEELDLTASADNPDPDHTSTDNVEPVAAESTISDTIEEQNQDVFFVNDDIEGLDTLLTDLTEQNSDALIVVLDSKTEGIAQMSETLSTLEDVDAIHLFSHGTAGTVKLGSTWLDNDNLDTYSDEISGWSASLSEEGDILLYGCDLASGSSGQELLENISELTDADVAASDDTTGHSSQGGDWVLEYRTGSIEATLPLSTGLQDDWVHILADETVADDFNSLSYDNSSGSVDAWDGNWIEIGEPTNPGAGNITLDAGRLRINTANDGEFYREIYRIADLSYATSATLSFDFEGVNSDPTGNGDVWVTIRPDSGSPWSNLTQISINGGGTGNFSVDISGYISDTTEINFSSDGLGSPSPWGTSTGADVLFIDNLQIDYSTADLSPLWISTKVDVSGHTGSGISDWQNTDIIGIGDPGFTLGDTTSGSTSMQMELSALASHTDTEGIHYVGRDLTIGASDYELKQGDILFTGANIDMGDFGLTVEPDRDDIIHFNYSTGTYHLLFDGLFPGGDDIRGLTLVEKDTLIGDPTNPSNNTRMLHEGDLLLLRSSNPDDLHIWHYETIDVENPSKFATTSGSLSVLLDGTDKDVDFRENLSGIELLENDTSIGGLNLDAGTILLGHDWFDVINGVQIGQTDIMSLDISSTTLGVDSGVAVATKFLDGSDIGFSSGDYVVDGITLTLPTIIGNSAPSITDGPDTAALTETNASLASSGTLTVTDPDITDLVTASVDALVVSGTSDRTDPLAPSDLELLTMLSLTPTAILDATEITDTLTWDFDSGTQTFNYLAVGETLVLQYTVKAEDNDATPLYDTETVTITITGTNDAPVITDGPDSAVLNPYGGPLLTGGVVTISDTDTTDLVTASVDSLIVSGTSDRLHPSAPTDLELQAMLTVGPTAILDGTETTKALIWGFSSGTETFDYLAPGKTLILQYTIKAEDNDGTPLSDTETVTITITGPNEAPVITDGPDTAALTESNSALNSTGTLTVSDVNTAQLVTATVDSLAVSGTSDRTDPLAPTDLELQAMLSLNPGVILDGTQSTNSLTWDFDSGTETFDYLAAGETLVLQYTVKAEDDDSTPLSDTETVTITITGSNDAPVITGGSDTAALTENNSPLTTTGTVTVTDQDTTDLVDATVDSLVISGTSDRTDPVAPTDLELQAMLSLTPGAILDGTETTNILTWDFDSGTETFDYLAAGETLVLQYTIKAEDNDGTPLSDTETVTITITGSNDAPVITGGPDTAALTENNSPLTTTGTVTVSDQDTTDLVNATVDSLLVSGTSDRTDPVAPTDLELQAMLSLAPGAILDGTQSTNSLTWDFDSGTETFDYLAAGETLVLQYTIKAEDDDGTTLSDTETVTITITGSNDAPVITDGPDSVGLTETNAALSSTGTLTVTDIDTTDLVNASVDSLIVGGTSDRTDPAAPTDLELQAMLSLTPAAILDGTETTNSLTWDFDSGTETFDYLAAGETLVLQYTIKAEDDNGTLLSDTETVTITITGSNDAPVITDGPDSAGLTETNAALTTNGTLTVTDVNTTDLVTASVDSLVVTGTSDRTDPVAPTDLELQAMLSLTPAAILDTTETTNSLTWDFDSGTETFDYLAAGETLVLQYTIKAEDDNGTPLSDTETVTITITGSNDAPVISNGPDTAGLTETNAALNTNSTLTVTDTDTTDLVNATVDSLNVSGTSDRTDPVAPTDLELQAMLSLTPAAILDGTETTNSLTWDFDSGSETFDYLAAGETLVLQYTIKVEDDNGTPLSDTETVTISITGSNDAPVITDGPVTAGLTETNASLTTNGTLTVTDQDTTDLVTATVDSLIVGGTSDRTDPVAPTDLELQAMLSLTPSAILGGTETTNSLTWDFDSGSETFDYLAAGETLVLQYTIKVEDDNGTPLSDTETVTITITGSNDAPAITDKPDTAGLTETNAALSTTGTLTVTDMDTTNLVNATVDSLIVGGTSDRTDPLAPTDLELQAMLSLTPAAILDTTETTNSLTWNFDSGTETFDYLAAGETLVLQYTIKVEDNDGTPLSDTETLTITITGSNDQVTATNTTGIISTFIEDNDLDLTDIVITDIDNSEIVTAKLTLQDPSHGSLSTSGAASYKPDTGVWRITGNLAEVNSALAAVNYQPSPNFDQNSFITIQISDGLENSTISHTGTIILDADPRADTPDVTNVSTDAGSPSGVIYITPSALDGAEVTHFQIVNITNGTLELPDGTQINNGDFISVADGTAGVHFIPADITDGSFGAISSEDGLNPAPQSTIATSTIKVNIPTVVTPPGPDPDPPPPVVEPPEPEVIEEETVLDLAKGQPVDKTPTTGSSPDNGDAEDSGETESQGDDKTGEDLITGTDSDRTDRTDTSNQEDTPDQIQPFSVDLSFRDLVSPTSIQIESNYGISNKSPQKFSFDAIEESPLTISNYSFLDLDFRERSSEEYEQVKNFLDNFREETDKEELVERTVVGSAIAASTGLSAGYVIWLLRSGALISSLLSSLPAWQLADPLAILVGAKRSSDEDDDSIESILANQEASEVEKPNLDKKDEHNKEIHS